MFRWPEKEKKPPLSSALKVVEPPEGQVRIPGLEIVTAVKKPEMAVANLTEVATMADSVDSPDISLERPHNALIINVSSQDLRDSVKTVKSLIEAGMAPEKSTVQALIHNNRGVDENFPIHRTRLPDEIALVVLYRAYGHILNNQSLLNNTNRPLEQQTYLSRDGTMLVFVEEQAPSVSDAANLLEEDKRRQLAGSGKELIDASGSSAQLPAVLLTRDNKELIRLIGQKLELSEQLLEEIENGSVHTELRPEDYRRLMEFAGRFNFWVVLEKTNEASLTTEGNSNPLISPQIIEFPKLTSNGGFQSLEQAVQSIPLLDEAA